MLLLVLTLFLVNALLFLALFAQPLEYLEGVIGLNGALGLLLILAAVLGLGLPALVGTRVFEKKFSPAGRAFFCVGAAQILFLLGALGLQPELVQENLVLAPSKLLGQEHLAVRALERVSHSAASTSGSIKGQLNSPIEEVKVVGSAGDRDRHRTRLWETDVSLTSIITLRPGYEEAKLKVVLSSQKEDHRQSQEAMAAKIGESGVSSTEFTFARPEEAWQLGRYDLEVFVNDQPEFQTEVQIVELEHRKIGEVVKLLPKEELQQATKVDGCWLAELEPGVEFESGVATIKREGKFLGDANLSSRGGQATFRPLGAFLPKAGDAVYYRKSGPRHCVIEDEKHTANGTHGKLQNPDKVASAVAFRQKDQFSLYLFEKPLAEHEPAQIYSIRTLPYAGEGEKVQAQPPYPRIQVFFTWTQADGLSKLQAFWVKSREESTVDTSTYPLSEDNVDLSLKNGRLKMSLRRLKREPHWDIQLETDIWTVDDFISLKDE